MIFQNILYYFQKRYPSKTIVYTELFKERADATQYVSYVVYISEVKLYSKIITPNRISIDDILKSNRIRTVDEILK